MKCIKCKNKEAFEGICSRTASSYCVECHDNRNWIKRVIECFTKGEVYWNYND